MANKIKKQPLYDQLVELLKEKIEEEMEVHDLLASERELSELYGVSRTTVRLALQELENMGLVYRQHGKGTFVSDLKDTALNLVGGYSFTEQMKSLGKVPVSKVLSFEKIEANKYLANHLNVRLGTKLIKIKRLRIADDIPMMLERTFLPLNQFLTLTKERLEEKAMYDIFKEDFQVTIKLAEEDFYASVVTSSDAQLLKIHEGAPVLHLVRKTYNMKNEIIEFTESSARGDQFRYKIVHSRF